MSRFVIKTKELPQDVQFLLKNSYEFNKTQVFLKPCTDFTCPTSYCDYNIMTLIVYNQITKQHKSTHSGHYECHMNWTREEIALYKGEMKSQIPDPSIWFFVLDTYPEPKCTVFCHPDAMAKALTPPQIELTDAQKRCLFLTRSLKSFARPSGKAWDTTKAELYELGLMTRGGALTIAGKNIAYTLKEV